MNAANNINRMKCNKNRFICRSYDAKWRINIANKLRRSLVMATRNCKNCEKLDAPKKEEQNESHTMTNA